MTPDKAAIEAKLDEAESQYCYTDTFRSTFAAVRMKSGPPERVTQFHGMWPNLEPHDYILASVVERREKALREALESVVHGNWKTVDAIRVMCAVALAAAPEDER